jgi:hypothetical protein
MLSARSIVTAHCCDPVCRSTGTGLDGGALKGGGVDALEVGDGLLDEGLGLGEGLEVATTSGIARECAAAT